MQKESLFCDDDIDQPADHTAAKLSDATPHWTILIVDDEPDIHTMTQLVLRSFQFDGRSLRFLSAYTAAEARNLLQQEPEIAVILLDVVMEQDDSGLVLVRYIRNELANTRVRIILRTGQPGFAPEEKVTSDYDINDYKEKSELTKPKLFACLTTAIRSYRDINIIENSRTELQRIVQAAAEIFQLRSMKDFCQAVLQQLSYLLNLNNPALHLQTNGFVASYSRNDFSIIASIGRFSDLDSGDAQQGNAGLHEADIPACLIPEIQEVIRSGKNQFRGKWYITSFESSTGLINIVCIECQDPIETVVRDHIELFNMNVAIAFNNLYLNKDIFDTQREIIYSLGEIVESRSKDASYHIHRVSEYTYLLCRKMGMSPEDTEIMKIAAVMHDVGKMSIPDNILNKPGKLSKDEFEIIKTHTSTGHRLLKSSNREIFNRAAEIALSHHERWDGQGYPEGRHGTEIPLSARIVAVADVFDALTMDRVYRKAWEDVAVFAYIEDESGKAFDPQVVEQFIKARDEVLSIKQRYAESEGFEG